MKYGINKYFIYAVLAVSLGVAVWGYFHETPQPEPAKNNAVAINKSGNTSLTPLNELLPDPLAAMRLPSVSANALATRGTVAELRRLAQMRSLLDAKIAAAQSDDPVVWVNSFLMGMECWNQKFTSTEAVNTSVTYSGIKPDLARMMALMATWPPTRVMPPLEIREKHLRHVKEQMDRFQTGAEPPELTVDEVEQDHRTMLAPTLPEEDASFEKLKANLAVDCAKSTLNSEFGKAYRATQDRFAEKGMLGALIGQSRTGRVGGDGWEALSDANYELAARAVRERSPDGLAAMLLTISPPVGNITDLDDEFAVIAAIAAPMWIGQLSSCELAVSDCNPSSYAFREACANLGGCHQPDLASLIRYVLARDGLAPDLIDKNVARVLDAIRRGDLDALGIRRKTKS